MGQSVSMGLGYGTKYAWNNPNTIIYFIAAALIIAGSCTTGIVNKDHSDLQRSNQRLIGVLLISIGLIFAGFAWGRTHCDFTFMETPTPKIYTSQSSV